MALSDILKQGLSHPTAMAATATAAPMATLCNENGRFILFRPKNIFTMQGKWIRTFL